MDVLGGNDHSALTGQLLIVHSFQPVGTAVFIGKPDRVRCKGAVRIDAFGRRLEENAADLVVVDKAAHLIRLGLVDLLLDDLVL